MADLPGKLKLKQRQKSINGILSLNMIGFFFSYLFFLSSSVGYKLLTDSIKRYNENVINKQKNNVNNR